MRKLLLCLLAFTAIQGYAQQASLKGTIVDTLEKRNLENAVVFLLRKSDSTLYKFVRSDKNGIFQLNSLDSGKYFLLITYPKFADFGDEVALQGGTKDLGLLPLIQKSALLETVIVKQQWSIRMKGDTVEYRADSFKVEEGATVKDLLRKLPGLQVDKNGQVTAQGQKVEKVLVDGEEFFGDDPAVVIENLRADAVDKVQSYDKKSDQAEFTGVDDGTRSKTLNLVLKDDKKKGYLGKVVVGGGTEERYSGEAMLNYFKGKKKISVYGIGSNTGRTGLGWEDRGKFGEGNDFEDAEVEMGAGFIMINGGDFDNDFGDWDNTYSGEGIPRSIKGGAHFSNKWNEDRQKGNGNYTIKDTRILAEGNSLYKYILPDSAYYIRENHRSTSKEMQQMLSGTYDIKFDSLSSLRIRVNGKFEDKDNFSIKNSETDNEELMAVNRNYRRTNLSTDNKIFLGSVLWRQKFKKKGRTMSFSASQKQSESDYDGFLFSYTDFYDNAGAYLRTDSIDQYKTSSSKRVTTTSKIVYTEPAGKKGIVEFNYSFQRVSSRLDRKSFDEVGGKYSLLNNLFSVRYGLNYLSNSAGIKYQFNGKKLTANIGTNLGFADYRQKDSLGKQIRHFNYTNLFPTARITYRFTSQRSLNVSYSGSPQPPSVEQIQPTLENINPLFITIGNPNLDQAFGHNISFMFNDFKLLTGRNIWISGGMNTTHKAIVTDQEVVSGITTQQYINASGNLNYWLYANYGFKLKKADIYIGLNGNSNGSNFVNFINGEKNRNQNRSYGASLYSGKYKENKFDAGVEAGVTYNRNQSSISNSTNSFWTQRYNLRLNYYLTKRFQIGSDINFDLRQKTDVFTGNNNFTIWNMYLSYRIFKKKNGIFRLEANDILKERRGFDRQFNGSYLYERNYNTLGRYAMLSFTWNFTKTPGQTK